MKAIIAVTALVASVASASAMTSADVEIERYVGAAEAATLTEAEVLTALNFIQLGLGRRKARLRSQPRQLSHPLAAGFLPDPSHPKFLFKGMNP